MFFCPFIQSPNLSSKHRLIKSISMAIAWRIKTIIITVTSALTGALLVSRALLKLAQSHGVTLNGMVPKDDRDTYLDEVVSYVIAFIGIWFQFKIRFDIPFPLNLFLWPLEIIEYLIKFSITKA